MSRQYSATVISRFWGRCWWLLCLAAVAVAAVGSLGWRELLAALMVVLIARPAVMLIIAAAYLTRPSLCARTRANRWVLRGDRVWLFRDEDDATYLIECDRFTRVDYNGAVAVLTIGRGITDFVLVPSNLVPLSATECTYD